VTLGWDAFERAMDGCKEVLRQVPAGRWVSPSPCEGWSARDVTDHLIAEIRWGADLVVGNEGSVPSAPVESNDGEAPVVAWEMARRRLEEVCTPQALDRQVRWPFGEQSVERGLGLFSLEILIHTWDIARAAGLDVTLDPDLVHVHLLRLQRVGHLLRGPGMYGPELPAPPDADEQQRLLSFLGRKVI
jgi:uncharacterized protein (TIGR03086 family)